MNEIYIVNGERYEVSPDRLQEFFQKFPNAYKQSDAGKEIDSTVDPTVGQDVMGSQLDSGSLESYETPQTDITTSQEDDTWIERTVGKNIVTDYFGDLWRAGEQGMAQGATVDEAFDIYKKGKNISDDELKRYIEVSDALDKTGASDEMREYEKIKNEAGGGVWGFMKGMVMTRGQVIPQVIVSSAAAMARTFFDSEEAAGITAATATAGAGVGAGVGATAGTIGGPIGTAVAGAIGWGTGAIGGAVAGLTGSMETALTLTELLKEKLGGKEFNKENIRALLEDEETFNDIKRRALARGATIGAVEGITVGLSRGVGAKLLAKGAGKGKIARTITGVEMAGGATGEALGQVAAEQEFDIAEVLMEGVAEAKGLVTSADILAKKEYKINGEKRTRKEVLDIVNDPNTKAEDLSKIQFDVIGDQNLNAFINKKQNDAVFETQIDPRIEGEDRKTLVDLENQRIKAEADTKKKGIFKVANAEETLNSINSQIENITNKYEGVDRRTSDVRARKKIAGEVREEVAERNFQANMAFAKKHSELYGLKFNELTQGEIQERFKGTENAELAESLGGIIGDEIIINKDLAKTRVYGDNVGNHELLHGIIKASKANITQETINDFLNIIGEENKVKIQERLDKNYTQEYVAENLDEYFTAFSDAIANNEIAFNDSVFTKIADVIRRMFANLGLAKVDFESGRGAYNFLKDYNKSIHKGALSRGVKAKATDVVFEDTVFSKAPETLIKTIKRGGNPRQVAAAEDALVPQYQALALEALGYKEAKGDILRENVVSAVNEYYEAIVRNYDSKKGAFSTHVYNNIAPKNDTIFEKAKTLAKRDEGISIDAPEAMQIADTTETTDKGPDTRRKKTNILKIGKVEKKANTIKKIVKVKKGDTFKEVSDNNTGKVAEEIFDVPANKITDPKKNLTYAKKIKDGIPEPSEAGNIQSFYGDKQTVEQLVKILPPENVTSSDADINEIGENIDVDREVLGRGLGLTNRMLNYFYNKTNRRSKGLSSQPFIWELKSEFKKPTSEVINQLQEDLGITPRGKLNNYNRNIGQLLKGMAKFQAQQTSLSTAQRILTEQKASKKQIASVTAAQSSKVAFSKSVDKIINIRSLFELEQKGIDKLLKVYNIDKTFNLRNEQGRENFVKAIEETLLPLMPREFWFGADSTVFTASNKAYGLSMSTTDGKRKNKNNRYKKPKEAKAYNDLRNKIKALKKLDDSKFGKPIIVDGKEIDFKVSSYDTMFGDAKKIKSKIKNGDIEAWNKKVALIHKEMWKRFNGAINQDGKINKETTAAIGTYLKLVGSDTNHWHKLGAQFVGYSDKITGTRFEYEHAMPATAAYLYLMDAALSDSNFNASYSAVIDNYKLIALDKAMDKKLTSVGLQRKMPEGWDLMRDKWYDRYFNDLVNNVEGGIDPNSIVGLDGKTFGEMFNIKKPITKQTVNKTKKINKAIVQSRKTIKEREKRNQLSF